MSHRTALILAALALTTAAAPAADAAEYVFRHRLAFQLPVLAADDEQPEALPPYPTSIATPFGAVIRTSWALADWLAFDMLDGVPGDLRVNAQLNPVENGGGLHVRFFSGDGDPDAICNGATDVVYFQVRAQPAPDGSTELPVLYWQGAHECLDDDGIYSGPMPPMAIDVIADIPADAPRSLTAYTVTISEE